MREGLLLLRQPGSPGGGGGGGCRGRREGMKGMDLWKSEHL